MGLVLLALTCAVIAGAIGHCKGMLVRGALLGLFLGPIGVAIAWALRGERQTCPACLALIPSAARICMHCRSPLHNSSALPAPTATELLARQRRALRDLGGIAALLLILLMAHLLWNS